MKQKRIVMLKCPHCKMYNTYKDAFTSYCYKCGYFAIPEDIDGDRVFFGKRKCKPTNCKKCEYHKRDIYIDFTQEYCELFMSTYRMKDRKYCLFFERKDGTSK